MQVLVTQIGARRHYAVPAALQQAGMLTGLYTDVSMAAPWLRTLKQILSPNWQLPGWKSLQGRVHPGVPDDKVTCLWASPWAMWKNRKRAKHLGQYARWVAQNEAFGREVVRRGFGQADTVYAFNGAAVEIFEAAKAKGLKCILDMTIAPLEVVERLLTEERQRFPNLETETYTTDSPNEMIARERREWKLADLILCGSEYVAETLVEAGVESSKCRVVRWGYSGFSVPKVSPSERGRVRILIAGTVELRKGVPYVLQAVGLLNDPRFHFRFVGPNRLNMRAVREQLLDSTTLNQIEFAGPVPRTEMTHEYQNADILLHASLAEGSANVCYEAMAHGLPVIATPNAGSVVKDGVTGFLIPIRDPEAIAQSLLSIAENAPLRESMGVSARQVASGLTLQHYQAQLSQAIQEALSPQQAPAAPQSRPTPRP
ncbi:MAG: glycosyltransferase family 4 protein [Planctomycetaceae bacterium]